MTLARVALGERNFAVVDKQLEIAAGIPKLDDHKAKLKRLNKLTMLVKQFWDGFDKAIGRLDAGSEIKVGSSTIVIVVEKKPESIIIRVGGQNREYPFSEIRPGLAIGIAQSYLDPTDSVTRILKGAYLASLKGAGKDEFEKAKAFWQEAMLGGEDVEDLLPVLTDKYDFK